MRYSVLLPTRNRLAYLRYAVETALGQGYDDMEIVVSDNCSEDDIAGYVASVGDPRVKYVRTDRSVPVTDNWNNALDHSSGEYVVMLGDDDCLLDGYFEAMDEILETYDAPQVVRTRALLYAYPGVMPGFPDGFLQPFPESGVFKAEADAPFWIERDEADQLVEESLNFRMRFGYNMQFSLMSRALVDALRVDGRFFHSPFPDFYASNLLLLGGPRVLVVPQPWVVVGITPKSYGFYHFNGRQEEGIEFLQSVPEPALAKRLEDVVLPGMYINTGWLYAMEALRLNWAPRRELTVNYARYRASQIDYVYEHPRRTESDMRTLLSRMTLAEKALFYGYKSVRAVAKLVKHALPSAVRAGLIRALTRARGEVTAVSPEWSAEPIRGKYMNIGEVFEQVSAARV